MSAIPADATITGAVTLRVAGEETQVTVTVPRGDTGLDELLPIFRALADALVDRAVARTAAAVSCRMGCAACCRQAVPIAPSEARALAALVADLPEPRRDVVTTRFAAGRAALAAAGVDTRAGVVRSRDEHTRWTDEYLAAGVDCPFLDDELCSIYAQRPAICREFLVTSPPANCRTPNIATIRRVPVAGSVSRALFAVDVDLEGHGRLTLIDALDWVAAHPVPPPGRPGPQVVEAVFAAIAAKS